MSAPAADLQPTFNSMSSDVSDLEELMASDALEAEELEQVIEAEFEFDDAFVDSQLPSFDQSLFNQSFEGTPTQGSDTGFFGIQATGNRVVFVIDNSPSMGAQDRYRTRFQAATKEVINAIRDLGPEREFFVYCFSFQKRRMAIGSSFGHFVPATKQNIDKLEKWFDQVGLESGTDPRESIVAALKMDPSCVYLLSDGQFNGRQFNNGEYGRRITAVQLAREHNKIDCPIHTIGFHDRGNQRDLERIAQASGGIYKFVAQDE